MQHLWNANITTSQQKRKPTPTGTQIINQFIKLLSNTEHNSQSEQIHTETFTYIFVLALKLHSTWSELY